MTEATITFRMLAMLKAVAKRRASITPADIDLVIDQLKCDLNHRDYLAGSIVTPLRVSEPSR